MKPASAKVEARLIATIVLPSPGIELVTAMTRGCLSTFANCRLARSWRKFSARALRLPARVAIGSRLVVGSSTMTPITGLPANLGQRVGILDAVVEDVADDSEGRADEQAEQQAERDVEQRLRGHRRGGRDRGVGDEHLQQAVRVGIVLGRGRCVVLLDLVDERARRPVREQGGVPGRGVLHVEIDDGLPGGAVAEIFDFSARWSFGRSSSPMTRFRTGGEPTICAKVCTCVCVNATFWNWLEGLDVSVDATKIWTSA